MAIATTVRRASARSIALIITLLLALAFQPLASPSSGMTASAAELSPPLSEDPEVAAQAAAGWLALELADGERLEGEFGADVGLTADAVFALAAAGVAADQLRSATDWLATQAPAYTQGVPADEDGAVYAGATAKLILALLVDDRDVRDVGGLDLVAQLEDREQPDGRFTDASSFGEYSSTLSQSLAILALERAAAVDPSQEAVGSLLDQQCADGGFRFDPDASDCTSSVDTTGFVVQALAAVGGDAEVAAIEAAADWLVEVQADDGSYGSDDGPNANSTALAANALGLATATNDRDTAAASARDHLLALRTSCEGTYPGAFPFSAEEAGDVPRATAQVIPALTGVSLAEVSADGASTEVPALLPFADVVPGSTHAPAICELSARGAIQGFDERTFGPERNVTRAQTAAVLTEVLGLEPAPGQPFDDVTEGSTHAGAIAALEAEGIVEGRADGTFGPQELLRRDQAASLLARALELELEPAPGQPFDDVAEGSTHAGAIAALFEVGVTNGTTETTYAPDLQLRRDRFASLLQRSFPVDAGDAGDTA